MIIIKIRNGISEFKIEAQGHALFNPKGKDVICASVSVLLQNWHLSEMELCHADIAVKKENGSFIGILKNITAQDRLLINSLSLSLIALENQYKKYINVTVEEYDG